MFKLSQAIFYNYIVESIELLIKKINLLILKNCKWWRTSISYKKWLWCNGCTKFGCIFKADRSRAHEDKTERDNYLVLGQRIFYYERGLILLERSISKNITRQLTYK